MKRKEKNKGCVRTTDDLQNYNALKAVKEGGLPPRDANSLPNSRLRRRRRERWDRRVRHRPRSCLTRATSDSSETEPLAGGSPDRARLFPVVRPELAFLDPTHDVERHDRAPAHRRGRCRATDAADCSMDGRGRGLQRRRHRRRQRRCHPRSVRERRGCGVDEGRRRAVVRER